jgi:pyruvate dehydrogenase E2 component (dihydrolipoamide acetyltransferase)
MIEFKMPSLGADMEAGTLVAWQKKPGDPIHRGDLVAEVETDKGIIEIEAFATGVLEKVLVPVGEKVPVGTVLALIREEAGTPGSVPPAAPPTPVVAATTASPLVHETGRLPMSPSARRLARELGVDPTRVRGTGHGGAITREDIERASTARAPVVRQEVTPPASTAAGPPKVESVLASADRQTRMRQTIAAAMSRSKREIPHYYLSTTIDFQPAMNWLTEANSKRPITERLLYGVLLLKGVALALREVPEMNCVWEEGHPVLNPSIHVGMAISLRQGGLIAPAIHDTDQKSLDQLMREFFDLVDRARAGGLRSSELSDPTITVTSLGEQGVDAVFGVIFPPQTAIVGFGKVVERPWSIRGGLMSRQVITATLSADHRVTDGHRGGRFLAAIDRLLQEPEKL